MSFISKLFNTSASELSGATWGLIIAGIIIGLIAFIIITKICLSIERATGKYAFSPVKIGLVAAPLVIFTVAGMFKVNLPYKLILLITAVIAIAVMIWNILTYRPIAGLLFSVMHIGAGLFAGVSIAAVIIMAIFFIILAFFGGSSSGTGSSGSIPSIVIGENDGCYYHVVQGANGEYYVDGPSGSSPIRNGDYANRYIDSAGNRYYSR